MTVSNMFVVVTVTVVTVSNMPAFLCSQKHTLASDVRQARSSLWQTLANALLAGCCQQFFNLVL